MAASTKNGFMRVANEIAEALINAPLSGREYKVLLFIMRQTYGYNRDEHGMSLKYMSEKLNIKVSHLCQVLSSLKNKNIIICEYQGNNAPQKISINKCVESWQGTPFLRNSPKKELPKKGTPQEGSTSTPLEGNKVLPGKGVPTLLKTDIKDRDIKTEGCADAPPPPAKPQKHKFGEYKNVLLTDEEYQKLKAEMPNADDYIERLSSYVASAGKAYKSHFATIRNWYRKDCEKNGRDKQDAPAADEIPDWLSGGLRL